MSAKQTNFYATRGDIAEVLAQFEAAQRVIYVLTGLFDIDTPQIFETHRTINSLSVSTDGDANHVPGYLIVTDRNNLAVREVPQKTGRTKFAVDQSLNPDSLFFQSGGTFADRIVVPGRIGITHLTPDSKRLYSAFAKLIVKNFSKVKSYYVGREAYALWKNGMRFRTKSQSQRPCRSQGLQYGLDWFAQTQHSDARARSRCIL